MFNLGGKSEAEMKKLKLNEIKNGRLAMLAVFGYGAQVRQQRLTVRGAVPLPVWLLNGCGWGRMMWRSCSRGSVFWARGGTSRSVVLMRRMRSSKRAAVVRVGAGGVVCSRVCLCYK